MKLEQLHEVKYQGKSQTLYVVHMQTTVGFNNWGEEQESTEKSNLEENPREQGITERFQSQEGAKRVYILKIRIKGANRVSSAMLVIFSFSMICSRCV